MWCPENFTTISQFQSYTHKQTDRHYWKQYQPILHCRGVDGKMVELLYCLSVNPPRPQNSSIFSFSPLTFPWPLLNSPTNPCFPGEWPPWIHFTQWTASHNKHSHSHRALMYLAKSFLVMVEEIIKWKERQLCIAESRHSFLVHYPLRW